MSYPKYETKEEALSEIDNIIYTLQYGEMNDNERTVLQNKCISLANYIRSL